MCDEAVFDSQVAFKLIPDWFVTRRMIKKLFTALYADANLLYVNEDFANAVFNWNRMGILNIDINDINHDDNFHEVDLDTIILIRLLAWHINFEKHKVLKFE